MPCHRAQPLKALMQQSTYIIYLPPELRSLLFSIANQLYAQNNCSPLLCPYHITTSFNVCL